MISAAQMRPSSHGRVHVRTRCVATPSSSSPVNNPLCSVSAKTTAGAPVSGLLAFTDGSSPALLAGAAVGAAISKVIGAQQPVTPLPPAPTPFGLPSAEMMPTDVEHIAGNIGYHAKYSAASTPLEFNTEQAYRAYANSVQERLVERWDATYDHFEREDPKMAYYISMEYLMGRTLANAVRNIGLQGPYAEALEKFGKDFEELEMTEK